MTKRIREGDFVNIYFVNLEPIFHVKVLYTPQAPGDSWIFDDEDIGGQIIYVQLFEKMVKVSKP